MEKILASAASAFVSVDGDGSTWSIGNERIAKMFTWQPAGGLHLAALANRQTGHTWQPDLRNGDVAGGEFALSWDGKLFSARQATALRAVRAAAGAGSVTLAFDLGIADVLEITLTCRAYAATAVLEQWLDITSIRDGILSRVAPATVSVDALASPLLHWVCGLQGHGAGMPATGPYPAFRMRHQPLGAVALASGLRSSWHANAWFVLDNGAAGEGLLAGLLYSGRWSATARAEGSCATLDLHSDGYAVPLAAGATWHSPAGFVGVYHGDLDDAAHVQHGYMRAAIMPPTPEDFPWVQYNTWFAHLVDIDEARLRQEAELAAQLGAEVFVIDAGWWEPSLRTSDNFTTGLGCWQPSREKFPSGIPAFGDYVRGLGMRFGIWVEPERVDLRQPASWSLRWLVRHCDAIVSPPWPPDTVSGWLCFGHPDVQAWAIDWISRLVADLNADWLKWDSNWWGVCTCDDHGHSVTDGEFSQVQGVHGVLAELRRRFPNLLVENCSGGATRNDFAMLANTHVTWLHDASTPSRRVRFHLAGATHFLPPELCNTWIVDADDESLADPATPQTQLDEIVRSRMFGAFGISARLMSWTAPAFATVRQAVAQYKQLRPLLKHGRIYHLLPQADLQCPDLALNGQWEACAAVDPSAAQGAIWIFRAADGAPVRRLRLRGLDAGRSYSIVDTDTAQTVSAAGVELMADGITADLRGRTSALLLFHAE